MTIEHFDVVVVGAGLSGIGAGYHLKVRCPGRSYVIFEARERIGGTWDLFRYPGVRSDSDMYTLGYSFRPWEDAKAIADGPSILKYVQDTAAEHGIDRKIRFGHRVRRASWSTQEARWTVEIDRGDADRVLRVSCEFLLACGGYYTYAEGYTPAFPGVQRFAGRIVHPQKWTDDIDYIGKRVVVIGSGATAVTLVPELAKQAAHVTMLQRSPTYVVARPSEDHAANRLRRYLPSMLAYRITRWKRVLLGLYLQVLSGLQITVDGERVDPAKTLTYKGMMYSGVPNLASAFGYTNASWTLKCDLTFEYICRLLNYMQRRGLRQCTPRNSDPTVTEQPWVDFSSGYLQRSLHLFPKQGSRAPWKLHQNYARDILLFRFGRLEDGVMEFSRPLSSPVPVRA